MKMLGITQAYNEEDCIANAIRQLVNSGHDTHVFDHGSTDGTARICQSFADCGVRYHLLDREKVPTSVNGIKVPDLWWYLGRFARSMLSKGYSWVTWLAADEVLRCPEGTLPTARDFERVAKSGTQVIRPLLRNFHMTTNDPNDEPNYLQRLRYFQENRKGHCPRAWRLRLTPTVMPDGLHVQDRRVGGRRGLRSGLWPEGTKVSNNIWLLDHYPLRTPEQAKRKVMKERNWVTLNRDRRYSKQVKQKCRNVVQNPDRLRCEQRKLEMPVEPVGRVA